MNILAVDFGEKNFGLAIAGEKAKVALPFQEFRFSSLDEAYQRLGELIKQENIITIVFGLPLSFKFEETPICEKIRDFAEKIEKDFSVKIVFVNEVLTTEMAKRLNKTTKNKNMSSALIILQDYLVRFDEYAR
jgi:putative Holliday junction resolvase